MIEHQFEPARRATRGDGVQLHIDLAPRVGDDHATEVARLERLGATRVDVGQVDVPWVVLADPEGNEFCVLTPRD